MLCIELYIQTSMQQAVHAHRRRVVAAPSVELQFVLLVQYDLQFEFSQYLSVTQPTPTTVSILPLGDPVRSSFWSITLNSFSVPLLDRGRVSFRRIFAKNFPNPFQITTQYLNPPMR